jgi:hypothetical protein
LVIIPFTKSIIFWYAFYSACLKNYFMATYSVKLINKQVVSVHPTNQETAPTDTILEQITGETIYATVEADSDEEAKQKANKVAQELQTGSTKKEIEGSH